MNDMTQHCTTLHNTATLHNITHRNNTLQHLTVDYYTTKQSNTTLYNIYYIYSCTYTTTYASLPSKRNTNIHNPRYTIYYTCYNITKTPAHNMSTTTQCYATHHTTHGYMHRNTTQHKATQHITLIHRIKYTTRAAPSCGRQSLSHF